MYDKPIVLISMSRFGIRILSRRHNMDKKHARASFRAKYYNLVLMSMNKKNFSKSCGAIVPSAAYTQYHVQVSQMVYS